MKDKMKELSAEVLCLAETISHIQKELKEEDMVLLKVTMDHVYSPKLLLNVLCKHY